MRCIADPSPFSWDSRSRRRCWRGQTKSSNDQALRKKAKRVIQGATDPGGGLLAANSASVEHTEHTAGEEFVQPRHLGERPEPARGTHAPAAEADALEMDRSKGHSHQEAAEAADGHRWVQILTPIAVVEIRIRLLLSGRRVEAHEG